MDLQLFVSMHPLLYGSTKSVNRTPTHPFRIISPLYSLIFPCCCTHSFVIKLQSFTEDFSYQSEKAQPRLYYLHFEINALAIRILTLLDFTAIYLNNNNKKTTIFYLFLSSMAVAVLGSFSLFSIILSNAIVLRPFYSFGSIHKNIYDSLSVKGSSF